jgi:hypothetical protein
MAQALLSDTDKISPKVAKVDELLDAHFAKTPKEKVLVLTQHVDVASHVVFHSKHKNKMIFYRGGMKDELVKFKTDKKTMVLVGVDKSLKYGHNLQVASRMIRLDVHWTPGDMDQVLARIYRPTKGTDKREAVHIDWVIGDGTVDVLKFRRTIRKMVINAKATGIIEEDEIVDRRVITVNETNLLRQVHWRQAIEDEVPDYTKYRDLEKEKWEKIRKETPTEDIPPKLGKEIKGDDIDTPWPRGVAIPCEGCLSFEEALEQLANNDLKEMAGYVAVTEFGKGHIRGARKVKKWYSVRIRLETGEVITARHILVGVLPEKVPLKPKKPKKPKKDYSRIDKPGKVIKIGKKEFLLTPKGKMYRLDARGGIKKLVYKLRKGEWLTAKNRRARYITEEIDEGLRKVLKDLGYKEKKPKKKKVVKKPKKKKVVKKPKKAPTNVSVRAINLSGLLGVVVDYKEKDQAEVKKALKGTRLINLPHYRLKIDAASARRVKHFINKGKLKPRNAKTLVKILERFRMARYNIRKMDDSVLKSLNKLIQKYMRSSDFYMYPVLLDERTLELWVNATRPQAVTKWLSALRQLKFKKRTVFFRLFRTKTTLPTSVRKVTQNLKRAKIGIKNLSRLKKDIATIRKTAKR